MEKKTLAIPTINGQLSSHFGHCEHFTLFHVLNNKIVEEKQVVPPPHEPGVLPPWLAKQGTTDIIAGGMGQRAIQLFEQQNIVVCVGAPQKTVKEIALDYINGKIQFGTNMCDH